MRSLFLTLFILGVIVSAMAGAFLLFRPKSQTLSLQTTQTITPSPTEKKYDNTQFGFSLSYPHFLKMDEQTAFFARFLNGDSADVALLRIITSSRGGISFDSFAREQIRLLCKADGPEITVSCPTIDSQQTLTTKEGVTGAIYYFNEVTKEALSQKEIARIMKGPFFVFDLTPQVVSGQAVLIIYPPLSIDFEDIDTQLLRQLAEGITLEKRDRKVIPTLSPTVFHVATPSSVFTP